MAGQTLLYLHYVDSYIDIPIMLQLFHTHITLTNTL